MSDPYAPTTAGPSAGATPPQEIPGPVYPAPSPAPASQSSPAERPEVLAGAAFAGGLIAALILKRIAS